ncbi:hypothetical protein SASC256_24870 [Staphylococcus argenteus]|nr:hypothetical protein SA19088_24270 [Staphylococcus argenteus]GJF93083.1 hypothetical protein SASC210_11670 [Staphylococcus argenteus]GJF95709.1 hypothetical protein SASC252_11680 [Staphylococcus argenteus]GJF97867.1 hypothetical protein SASC253_06650 [Staphylococcus argenteus]GJG00502.1 hypothetical protein SASC254_06640 [Staphylococcus argenteus]
MKKENIPANDFNTTLNSDDCWNKLTSKLKEQGLLTDGQKVTIHCNDKSNNTNTSVTGKVGEGISSGSGTIFTKRFIDKITIE